MNIDLIIILIHNHNIKDHHNLLLDQGHVSQKLKN